MQKIINFIAAIWQFFSGKKTILAAVLLSTASVMTIIGGNYGIVWIYWAPTIKTLQDIGTLLTGVGILHKVIKNSTLSNVSKSN